MAPARQSRPLLTSKLPARVNEGQFLRSHFLSGGLPKESTELPISKPPFIHVLIPNRDRTQLSLSTSTSFRTPRPTEPLQFFIPGELLWARMTLAMRGESWRGGFGAFELTSLTVRTRLIAIMSSTDATEPKVEETKPAETQATEV